MAVEIQPHPEDPLECDNCGQFFSFVEALNPIESSAMPRIARIEGSDSAVGAWIYALAMIGLTAAACMSTWSWGRDLDHGIFFFYFFAVAFAMMLIQFGVRRFWDDRPLVTFMAIILVEAIVVTRIVEVDQAGLTNFTLMLFLMVMGGIVQLVRNDDVAEVDGFGVEQF